MITSLDEIKKIADGAEVEIDGWEPEVPFVCKLKRVSMMHLVSKGKIPNPLMPAVIALFNGKKDEVNKVDAKQMSDIIDLFCKATLVEPTYEEVEEFLTDSQRTQIFNYAQGGLKRLEKFRKDKGDTNSNLDSERVQENS